MKTILVGKHPERMRECRAHQHDCWEIVVPIYGDGVVKSPKQLVPFSLGTAYVMPPGTEHYTYSEEEFHDIFIQVDEMKLSAEKITAVHGVEQLPALAELIWSTYQKRNLGYHRSQEAALELLVQLICDMSEESAYSALSLQTRDFLTRHVADAALDMAKVAREFGYNSDHIRRVFKEDFGETPMDFLDGLRLAQAKVLLKKLPDHSVAEISEQCGFADRFYFSRFFKKQTGMTPSQYRKAAQR